jgi:uracil-DNA glycosylase family 4
MSSVEQDLDPEEERRSLIREARQRLELLRRSGVEHLLLSERGTASADSANQPKLAATGEAVTSSRPRIPRRAMSHPEPEPATTDSIEEPQARVPEHATRHAKPPAATTPEPVDPPKRPVKAPVIPAAPGLVNASLFGELEFELPVIPMLERPGMLEAEAAIVAGCTKCKQLAETRTQTVYGTGSPLARLMFIGEAPGADEDRTGIPFVGRAGQLLTEMITKGMGIAREDVYIANILKCRPPENRQPTGVESANCIGYLERQIAVIRPQFICLLGLTAAQSLLETTVSMGHLRGKWYRYRGIATVVTYHPAYLLRSPSFKKQAWEDLQMLMKAMGLAIPRKKS